jgi:hypothetical protein
MTKSVDAKDKSLRELLSNNQYSIDFYQREYKWLTKQVDELVDDLTSRFLNAYQDSHVRADVADYPAYFLGSVVLSKKTGEMFIVDGQQRLTSITLLLIYLRNLQIFETGTEDPNIQALILSIQYGKQNFNLNIEDRNEVIGKLFRNESILEEPQDASAANILSRYQDIENRFPEECKGRVLPFFLDWLIERVQFVEISAYSDEDAYTIFETMNDRGLSLSPADMLKGYLLSSIRDREGRDRAEALWQKHIPTLESLGKEATNDFFRSWFRGKFALTYGVGMDYERLGPEFHRWLRDNSEQVGLRHSDDFEEFLTYQLPFFSHWYKEVKKASLVFDKQFPAPFFSVTAEASIDQGLLLMSCIDPSDSESETRAKLRVASKYLDIFVARRIWAGKILTRPALKSTFITLARSLRGMNLEELTARLYAELTKPGYDNFDNAPPLLTSSSRRRTHRLLARLTDYVESEAGSGESIYPQLVVTSGRSRFDIEHVWAKDFKQFSNQFETESEFLQFRNRLGALVLLPFSFNSSYQAMITSEKIPKYSRPDHNLLCASLAAATYVNNPKFRQWNEKMGFSFASYDDSENGFNRQAIEQRTGLYRELAKTIWAPEQVLRESGLDHDHIIELAISHREDIGLNPEIETTARRDSTNSGSRTYFDVSLRDLIEKGLIGAGDILLGKRAGATAQATAIVLENGSVELENGSVFSSLSPAAMALFGPDPVINGWDFWIHQDSQKVMKEIRDQYVNRIGSS